MKRCPACRTEEGRALLPSGELCVDHGGSVRQTLWGLSSDPLTMTGYDMRNFEDGVGFLVEVDKGDEGFIELWIPQAMIAELVKNLQMSPEESDRVLQAKLDMYRQRSNLEDGYGRVKPC